jgi:hypothetical protein
VWAAEHAKRALYPNPTPTAMPVPLAMADDRFDWGLRTAAMMDGAAGAGPMLPTGCAGSPLLGASPYRCLGSRIGSEAPRGCRWCGKRPRRRGLGDRAAGPGASSGRGFGRPVQNLSRRRWISSVRLHFVMDSVRSHLPQPVSLPLCVCAPAQCTLQTLNKSSQALVADSPTHRPPPFYVCRFSPPPLRCRQPPPFHCVGIGCGVGWEPFCVV